MPYNPGVQDISGQLYGQGIAALGKGVGNAITQYYKDKENTKLLDTSANSLIKNASANKNVSNFLSSIGLADEDKSNPEAIKNILMAVSGGNKAAAAAIGFKTIQQINESDRQSKAIQNAMNTGGNVVQAGIEAGIPIPDILRINDSIIASKQLEQQNKITLEKLGLESEKLALERGLTQAQIAKLGAETAALGAKPAVPAPSGFRYDASGRTLEAIPGGPEAIKQEEAKKKEEEARLKQQMATEAAKSDLQSTLGNIKDALNLINLEGAGGPIQGSMPSVFAKFGSPSTAALNRKFNSIKSALSLNAIRQLKELSQTGATGLGQISNKEQAILSSSIADLDITAPEEENIASLKKIQEMLIKLNTIPEDALVKKHLGKKGE